MIHEQSFRSPITIVGTPFSCIRLNSEVSTLTNESIGVLGALYSNTN